MRWRKGIFCVIYRKEKDKTLYLLLKRKLHWKGWEFCKGGGIGISGVKREVREETGQQAKNIKKYNLFGKFKYPGKLTDRKNYLGQTWKLYSCEIKNKKVKLDKREHSDYSWKEYKQALKMLTYSNQRRCLRFVNEKLN